MDKGISVDETTGNSLNWQLGLRKTFVPMDCEIPFKECFYGDVRNIKLADFLISEVRSTPHRVIRSKKHIQQDAPPLYYCNLQLSGNTTIRQAHLEQTSKPGDIVAVDTQHPYEIESNEAFSLLCFAVPKPVFKPHLSSAELPLGTFSKDAAGFAEALTAIAATSQNCDLEHAYRDYRFSGAILRLLALALESGTEKQSVASRAHRDDYNAIVSFINEQICNPELNIKMASQHFKMSERYIQKLFFSHGESFHNYVLQRRIHNCRDEISGFGHRQINIARIAYNWGFSDLSTFYRAFKRIVGCSPGDIKQQMAGGLLR